MVIALGAGALAVPLTSFAQQQGRIWRVGFLSQRQIAIQDSDAYYGPFRQGMRELGYVEGKNLFIEWRSAEGNNDRLPGLASELVNPIPRTRSLAQRPDTCPRYVRALLSYADFWGAFVAMARSGS